MAKSVVPCVFYKDPVKAMRWLEDAFGFETSLLVTDKDGNLGHAEVSFNGEPIGVGGEWSSAELLGPASMKSPASIDGVGSQFIRIYLAEGLDQHCARARAAGARIVQAPEDQFYGARTYRALDPEGHVWNFSQDIGNLSVEQMEQASGLTIRTGSEAKSAREG
jgi:uncharacterized glyoxalase superfamily protein PhnB